ncbi:MAG: UvrD-helicase domain-containing protein, partial [Nitrospinaceae bacterium]
MSDLTDAKERREALDPTRSFIIQAPAGSGKTELLIRRFLKLLSGVAYPEQILCMTFTRKAAGEMRSRIMAALKNAAENPPPPEIQLRETWDLAQAALQQDRLRNWRILTYHSRLKVQTIDSFCAWLVRHLPLTSRMGGALDPQENAGGSYREAIRRLLAKVEEESPLGQNVRAVMEHLDNDKSAFETRILQLLEKRSQWFLPFFRDTQISAGEKDWLQRNLQTVVESRLENTNDLIPDSIKRELPPLAAWAAGNLQNDKPGELISLLHLSEFPEPKIQNLLQWQDLTKLLLTDKGEFRKTVTKSLGFPTESDHPGANQKKRALLDIIESFSGNNTLRAFLNEVRLLPGESLSEEYWEVLKTSMELLQPLAKTLRQVFKEQEKTDFTEISLAALRALGEFDEENKLIPTDLMLSLDYQIQHILVDEYQDTSFKQFDMLYRLTAGWTEGDGRTLFIVGDPMQSIFRFRDAEVGLFLKTQNDGVGDVRLKKLTLKSNFRSQKKIVDWINGCFQDTFPKAQDIDRGAVPYAPSRAVLPPEASEGVVLHPRAGATAEVEAGQIADLITRLQKEWPDKTVAILVRARAHLKEILKEFRARGLAFQAEDIDPLTERWEILDLLALMRALRSPLDRVSWLSILRAPWCGLTLADLHRLCLNGGTTPVWSLLQDRKRLSELSPDGRERLQRFMDVLTPALAAFPGVSFRGLLEGVWIRLGGPACVPASSLPDIEVFFEEVGRVAESGALSRLDRFEQELERLYSSPSPKTAAVQVMTMHKAKGLEFDFVLIPGLGWRKRAEQNRLVFWILHGDSL